eukprot:5773513-Amphidinium_carterae.1
MVKLNFLIVRKIIGESNTIAIATTTSRVPAAKSCRHTMTACPKYIQNTSVGLQTSDPVWGWFGFQTVVYQVELGLAACFVGHHVFPASNCARACPLRANFGVHKSETNEFKRMHTFKQSNTTT